MNILFEELSMPQRAGGIEAATLGLIASLAKEGVSVKRSFTDEGPAAEIVPDCVHLHGIWSPTLAWRLLQWRRREIPCVVTLHGMLEPWALAHKELKKKLAWHLYQKRLLNMASVLHATSEREAENLRTLKLAQPFAMIPWGIEMEGTLDVEPPVSNINSLKRTALFVGRIYPVKGLPLLVEAWAKIRPVGWKMKIVGPDEAGHQAEVESMIRKAGLENEFEFTGPLEGDDLWSAYQGADLLISPSHSENFGMAIAEAMAHGLPVVTTHGVPWRLLEEERCGWWVPVSVESIASAIQDATQRSDGELCAMGERGRVVIAERFAWKDVAQQFIGCYQWILGRGPDQDAYGECWIMI